MRGIPFLGLELEGLGIRVARLVLISGVDKRSVQRLMRGEECRDGTVERIEQALRLERGRVRRMRAMMRRAPKGRRAKVVIWDDPVEGKS